MNKRRSFLCCIGFHREYLEEGFPLGSRNPLIVGLKCNRCGRFRCVNHMDRPTMSDATQLAFDQSHTWLEKVTGQRVIGTFVHFR